MTPWAFKRRPESRSPKALVVEDEALICEYLTQELQDMGFEVYGAHDVQSALQIASRCPLLDVAFVDLALPDRSGLELIAELNRMQPDLPIVVATNYAAMAVADLKGRLRGPMVLGKPYDHKSIADVLHNLNFQMNR